MLHSLNKTLFSVFCLGNALTLSAVEPPHVHDPSSILYQSGKYWSYSTGIGIQPLHSYDLMTWEAGPPVLPHIPEWVSAHVPGNKGHFWAPDIIKIKDRYLLYYSISTFGKNTSAIALLTSQSLDPEDPNYGWKDEGVVIQSSAKDDYNAIDPALLLDDNNRLWMSFGSFWSGILLVELDPTTGKRLHPNAEPEVIAYNTEIEAPSIIRHSGYYYLFVNWGFCCRSTDSTYNIRVGRSKYIEGPYLDKDGRDLRMGGGTLFLGNEANRIGPGHASVLKAQSKEWLSYHYYDASRDGAPTLSVRELQWTRDAWPEPGPMRTDR